MINPFALALLALSVQGVEQQRTAVCLERGSFLYRDLLRSLDGDDAPDIDHLSYLNVLGDIERSRTGGDVSRALEAYWRIEALRDEGVTPISLLASDWYEVDPAALEDGRLLFDGKSYQPSGKPGSLWKEGTTIAAAVFGPLVEGSAML